MMNSSVNRWISFFFSFTTEPACFGRHSQNEDSGTAQAAVAGLWKQFSLHRPAMSACCFHLFQTKLQSGSGEEQSADTAAAEGSVCRSPALHTEGRPERTWKIMAAWLESNCKKRQRFRAKHNSHSLQVYNKWDGPSQETKRVQTYTLRLHLGD